MKTAVEQMMRSLQDGQKPLTVRQYQVLDIVQRYVAMTGYSPSVRAVAAQLGVSSPSTAHQHLIALIRKGRLRRRYLRGAPTRGGRIEYELVRS